MKKDIEKQFFKAFEFGGTVCKCIDYFRQKYDLGYLLQRDEKFDEKWQNYYDVELPKQILCETEVFDDTVIRHAESPLIDEIENNLNECQTDIQKERYLFSLLKPFSELSRVYHPIAEIERIKKAIQECESEKTHWESLPQNEPLNDVAGKPAGTPKEQIEACNNMVEDYKKQIERLHHINKRFREITGQQVNDAGTVEACLSAFRSIAYMFANRLDALLLTYGIDFIKLQKESGIYLKAYRSVTDVDFYLGSLELAQKYIAGLPNDQAAQSATNNMTKEEKPQRLFTDYLHHTNKDELMKKLHELLDDKKAKPIAIVIKALEELSYIAGGYKRNELYRAMRSEFRLACVDKSINDFLNSNNWSKLSDNDIAPTKNILKAV